MSYTFTIEQGIKVQQAHLNEWKAILTPEAYAALEAYATRDNNKAVDGYDICRGEALRNFLQQYAINVSYGYKTLPNK